MELSQKVCQVMSYHHVLHFCHEYHFKAYALTIKCSPCPSILLLSCSSLSLPSPLPTVSPLHLLLCLLFVHPNYLPFLLSTPYPSLLLFTLSPFPHAPPSIPSLSFPSSSFLHFQECDRYFIECYRSWDFKIFNNDKATYNTVYIFSIIVIWSSSYNLFSFFPLQ